MTNNYLKYKIANRPSLEGNIHLENGAFYRQSPSKEHRFLSQKKISHNNHYRYHSNLKANDGFRNILQASIDPVEDQKLQYSQTELQNQMLQTLQDLGIRRGHSFQKEKIDFSLSSDALNTEHQNQILKKKMSQMKKELQYLRENEEKASEQLWQQKLKNSQLSNELSSLKSQFMEYNQKVALTEEKLRSKQSQIEQMKKKIQNKKMNQSQSRLDCLLDQLQNLKKNSVNYQRQIQALKENYDQQLTIKLTQQKQYVRSIEEQLQKAKQVGQAQLNKLMSIIIQKDRHINLLNKELFKRDNSQRKKSILVSDNPQNLKKFRKQKTVYKQQRSYQSDNRYMMRFLQFQRFIDEKIRQQRIKERKKIQRISKSAIAVKKDVIKQTLLNQYELQNQSRNFSLLLQRNQKLKYPDTVIQRVQTEATHY